MKRRFQILILLLFLIKIWVGQGACVGCPTHSVTLIKSTLISATMEVHNQGQEPFTVSLEKQEGGGPFNLKGYYHNPYSDDPESEIQVCFDFHRDGLPGEESFEGQEPGTVYHYDQPYPVADPKPPFDQPLTFFDVDHRDEFPFYGPDSFFGQVSFPQSNLVEFDLTFVSDSDLGTRRILARYSFGIVETQRQDNPDCDA